MNKNIIKIVAGFALMLSLVSPAVAVAPLALTAAEKLLTPIVFGGVSWLLTPSATVNVPKTGTATPTGINRNMLAKIGPASAIAVAGYIAYSDLKNLIQPPDSNHPYPALSDAIYKNQGFVPPYPASPGLAVGAEFTLKGGARRVTAVTNYTGSYGIPVSAGSYYVNGQPPSAVPDGSTITSVSQYWKASGPVSCNTTVCGYDRLTVYHVSTFVPQPSYTPRPDAEISPYVYSPTLGDIYPAVLTDLDKVIAANPSIVQLPSTLSSDIASAKKQLAADTISASNTKTVEALKSIRDAKQAAYNANPTPENKEALDKAEADLAAAEAKQAQDELTATKDKEAEEEKLAEEDTVFASSAESVDRGQ